MRKGKIAATRKETWQSPSGKFKRWSKELNEVVGADSESTDLTKRCPFDVALYGIPPGAARCPFHSHANQWEFYLIVSGRGIVRHGNGEEEAAPGDFFLFAPKEPHQLINRGSEELVYYCVADNPTSDHFYYPDSGKLLVELPRERMFKEGREAAYFEGEDESGGGWQRVD